MCNLNSVWFSPPADSLSGHVIEWTDNVRVNRARAHNDNRLNVIKRIQYFMQYRLYSILLLAATSVDLTADVLKLFCCCIQTKEKMKDNLKDLCAHTSLIFQSFQMCIYERIPHVDRLRSWRGTKANLTIPIQSLSPRDPVKNNYFLNQLYCSEKQEKLTKVECSNQSPLSVSMNSLNFQLVRHFLKNKTHIHNHSHSISKCQVLKSALMHWYRLESQHGKRDYKCVCDVNSLSHYIPQLVLELSLMRFNQVNQSKLAKNTEEDHNAAHNTTITIHDKGSFQAIQQNDDFDISINTNMSEVVQHLFDLARQELVNSSSEFHKERIDSFFNREIVHYKHYSLLYYTIQYGSHDDMKSIVENHDDPNLTDSTGCTLLEILLFKTHKYKNIVCLLIKKNATFYFNDLLDPLLLDIANKKIELTNPVVKESSNRYIKYAEYLITENGRVNLLNWLDEWKGYLRKVHQKAAKENLKQIEESQIFPSVLSRIIAEYAHEGFH